MRFANPNVAVFLDTRTLNVSGTTTFGSAAGGSYLFLMNGAVVNNLAGATWNIVNGNSGFSNGILNNGGGGPTIKQPGTILVASRTPTTATRTITKPRPVTASAAQH